jgi:hypothetical protein
MEGLKINSTEICSSIKLSGSCSVEAATASSSDFSFYSLGITINSIASKSSTRFQIAFLYPFNLSDLQANLFFNSCMTKSESPLTFRHLIHLSLQISKPRIKTSYSATLLVASNSNLKENFNISPLGD